MVNYSCEKCGKQFSQKGHYTKHLNKKNPCVVESKVKEMLDKVVEEKLNKLDLNKIDDKEETIENNNENEINNDNLKKDRVTHSEIHPSLILGLMANQIIFPSNNPIIVFTISKFFY